MAGFPHFSHILWTGMESMFVIHALIVILPNYFFVLISVAWRGKEEGSGFGMTMVGINSDLFPLGFAQAPFVFSDIRTNTRLRQLNSTFNHKSLNMVFGAGFIGVAQTADGEMRPEVGWVVAESV